MAEYTLIHGNRNYSSWSMRAWLALRTSGAEFETLVFHLGEEGVRDRIRQHSPTGLVPVLRHGDLLLWDSLAIGEYLAERFPAAGLWPADPSRRAVARAVTAEMHSGFPALRREMPFNVRRQSPGKGRGPGVEADIARIREVWASAEGPFLFGAWCLADVFYAPVVSRFRTYAVDLEGPGSEYAATVWEHPHVREWAAGAAAEPWVEPIYDL